MRKPKLLLLLVWLLLLALLLPSCKQPQTPQSGTSEDVGDVSGVADGDPDDSLPTELMMLKKGRLKYRIIIPQSASSAIVSEVSQMEDDIYQTIGYHLQIINDTTGSMTAIESAGEIIIGECLRIDSERVLSDLNYKDYALRVTKENIVIAAFDDTSLKNAIRSFRDCLKSAEKSVDESNKNVTLKWDRSINTVVRQKSYPIGTCTVDGVDISAFRIVYPKSSGLESEASTVRAVIGAGTGIVLPISDDSVAETEHEILVGQTNRALSAEWYLTSNALNKMEYRFIAQDGKFQIVSGGLYSISRAVNAFVKKMSGKTVALDSFTADGTVSIANEEVPAKLSDYRVMSYNILNGAINWGGGGIIPYEEEIRVEIIANLIDRFAPDILCLQELFEKWAAVLPPEIPGYTFVDIGITSSRVPILYKADKFRVVNSGAQLYPEQDYSRRMVAWALFEDVVTGERFVVINTHLSAQGLGGSEVWADIMARQLPEVEVWLSVYQQITDQYGEEIPVIATGDWNGKITAEPMSRVLNGTGLSCANSAAIDHILYSSGTIRSLYAASVQTHGAPYASDHRPQIMDFSFINRG